MPYWWDSCYGATNQYRQNHTGILGNPWSKLENGRKQENSSKRWMRTWNKQTITRQLSWVWLKGHDWTVVSHDQRRATWLAGYWVAGFFFAWVWFLQRFCLLTCWIFPLVFSTTSSLPGSRGGCWSTWAEAGRHLAGSSQGPLWALLNGTSALLKYLNHFLVIID